MGINPFETPRICQTSKPSKPSIQAKFRLAPETGSLPAKKCIFKMPTTTTTTYNTGSASTSFPLKNEIILSRPSGVYNVSTIQIAAAVKATATAATVPLLTTSENTTGSPCLVRSKQSSTRTRQGRRRRCQRHYHCRIGFLCRLLLPFPAHAWKVYVWNLRDWLLSSRMDGLSKSEW